MALQIERSSLHTALSLMQGIVERRTTVPILSHVLIEPSDNSVSLSATDLEVGIRTVIPCRSDKQENITLNARKLLEIVRESDAQELSLTSLDNDWVQLECGRAKFKMMGLDPRSFPAMPPESASKAEGPAPARGVKADLKIGAPMLAGMIDKTIFAVNMDEARYNLSGVFIESPAGSPLRMVATDGHRLALVERSIEAIEIEGGAIIPRKGLAEARRLLDQGGDAEVTLRLDGSIAWLKHGSTEISMRLIEGEFPDYRGVIPKESRYAIAIGRENLSAAIKRASIFSNERYHGVKFELSAGLVTISSTTPQMGEASESIEVDYDGDEFSIGFNASYIQEALRAMAPAEEVTLNLTDDVNPGVLTTPTDSGYTYVVMPMRL